MRNLLLSLCSGALIATAGYVAAQTSEVDRDTRLRLAKMDTSPAAFRKLDKDNDGRISPLEAAENPQVAAAFTMADRNKDGYLSREEFETLGSGARSSSDQDASRPGADRASQSQPKSSGDRTSESQPKSSGDRASESQPKSSGDRASESRRNSNEDRKSEPRPK